MVTDATPPAGGRRRPSPSSVRRGAVAIGVALFLTAVGILGYLAWEYVGTNIASKRAHDRIDNRLFALWRYPTPADLLGPGAPPAPGSPIAVLRVPRFGAGYAVPIIEGVTSSDLSNGVGHFPGAGPGQVGNFALSGHRATHGQPFRDLLDLGIGDRVVVQTAEATYTYVLDTSPGDLTVASGETWVVDPVPVPGKGEAPPGMPSFPSHDPSRALITLTTSPEIFHADDRSVAFGHLVATTPR